MGRPKKKVVESPELVKAFNDIDSLTKTTNPVMMNPIDRINQDDFLRKLEEQRLAHIPKIKVAFVREGAIFKKANEFAAGYDVKAFNMTVEEGYIKFMLGIKTELPTGWYAQVVHRSSNSKYDGILANLVGTIDCDFRGEWQARVKIIPQPKIFPQPAGDMLVQSSIGTQYVKLWQEGEIALQVLLHKLPEHQVLIVEESELNSTNRGEQGHGSTGTGL